VAIVSELKKMWLTFSPPECVPLKTAFDRIMSFAGATDLAALYLKGYCRNRRLRAMVLYLSADKQHMVTHLNPSNCDEHVQALAGDDSSKPNGYCFVPLVDLDNLSAATPTMTAAPQSVGTESSLETTPAPEKQKPGIKPVKDWPNSLLAPEMVGVVYETPDLLRDRPELVRHVRKFLKDEIGWEPKDNKPIHRHLNRLLSRINSP
jgi:hypothetical protein